MPVSIVMDAEVKCKKCASLSSRHHLSGYDCVIYNHTWHVTSHCAYRMASVWKEIQNLSVLLDFLGLKSLFHLRV